MGTKNGDVPLTGTITARNYSRRSKGRGMDELSAQIRKLGLLAACATFLTKTLLELVDSTCGINKALLTCEERVASRANPDVQILNC